MGEMRNAYNILAGKWNRTFGRARSRLQDNISFILGRQGGKVWVGCI
jgi:hypothetical protein